MSNNPKAKNVFFDFKLDSLVLSYDNILNINLEYDLVGASETDFSVRPFVDVGVISIWDDAKKRWVFCSDLWENMPALRKDMKVKIENIKDSKALLYFQIQDTKRIKIYETPTREVWSNAVYVEYINKLNNNLRNWNQLSTSLEEPILLQEGGETQALNDFKLKDSIVFYELILFVACTIISFLIAGIIK